MKKLAALIMAGALVTSMALSASAAYEAETDVQKVAFEIKKANTAQKFDGVISDGEYYKIDLKSSWISYAANLDADITTAKNTAKELYMSWTDTGVNIAAVVTLDKASYIQTEDAGNIWKDACIQVNAAATTDTGTSRLEYGIGKTTSDNKFIGNVWNQFKGTYTPTEGTNAYVTYTDGKLIYETTIPWANFLDDTAMKVGSQFGFCLVWSIGSGSNYIHIQLASGCTGTPGKAAQNFAKLTLAAAPEIVKEVATTTTSASTSDTGIVVSAALLALSIGGIAVVSRKKH